LPPGGCLATVTPLWGLLTAPVGSPLTPDELARLALWMDTYIPFTGHFTDLQEAEIDALRNRWKDLLELTNAEPAPRGAVTELKAPEHGPDRRIAEYAVQPTGEVE
jgi:hypothetical protein